MGGAFLRPRRLTKIQWFRGGALYEVDPFTNVKRSMSLFLLIHHFRSLVHRTLHTKKDGEIYWSHARATESAAAVFEKIAYFATFLSFSLSFAPRPNFCANFPRRRAFLPILRHVALLAPISMEPARRRRQSDCEELRILCPIAAYQLRTLGLTSALAPGF